MPSVIPFDFDGNAVRAIMHNDESWFVAKDIAVSLGYSNPRKAVRDHCKHARVVGGGNESFLPREEGVNDSFTLDPQTILIPEPDLYRLIIRSQLDSAEKFEQWVFEKVLPSLRKHGHFGVAKLEALALPSATLRLKPSFRTQALHCAVQVAKMQGGDEGEVDRLYEKYCEKFAAKPKREKDDPDCPRLVHEFVEDVMHVTVPARIMPANKKTQMKFIYEVFRKYCSERGMKRDDIPSMRVLGSGLKHRSDIVQVAPRSCVFYNLVPREEWNV